MGHLDEANYAKYFPKDLDKDNSKGVGQDYFTVSVVNLKIDNSYPFNFQWVFPDGTRSKWSDAYVVNTSTESVPAAPTNTVTGGAGFIKVSLPTFPANALRVDVRIAGGTFGSGTVVAESFTSAGTKTIVAAGAATPGNAYVVTLLTVTPSKINGDPSSPVTVYVTDVGETIQSPTNPNGFTSKRILAGVEVSWAGTYASSTFTGFEAINIYAGNSATATAGTYEQVGVLTGNNVKNTIVVPLGTYVAYGQAVYIHAAAVNKSGTVGTIQANVTNQTLGPGKATDADINDGAVVIAKLASDVLTVGNLKAGDINATSFIRAGTAGSARVEISSSTVGSVLPGLTVYASDGTTQLLRAPLTGGLSITGGGTFSGALSAATGTFGGNITASGGLFSVNNGVLTAQSGTIGGWTITGSLLHSSPNLANQIELNPATPKISLSKTTTDSDGGPGTITIDPISGIKDAAGNFKLTPSGNLTLKGSLTISTNPTYNYWTVDGFRAGAASTYLTTNVNTGVTLIQSADTTTDNTDGAGQTNISVPQKIEVNSTQIIIQGLAGVGNGLTALGSLIYASSGEPNEAITKYLSSTTYANTTDTFKPSVAAAAPTATYGSPARYRMIVADPYDFNKLKRGFGVYYGVRSNAPPSSTGFVGDVWVSW